MRAIETRYAGCNFRSRLEARWAVFFDTLGIPWEYEPQGFEWVCDHGYCHSELHGTTHRYLPDFWLPSINTWFEVKGELTKEEGQLHLCFAESYRAFTNTEYRQVKHITAIGDIPRTGEPFNRDDTQSMHLDGGMDYDYMWCQCNHCGKYGIEYDGRAGRICQHDNNDKDYTVDLTNINRALEAARSARFN